MGDSTIYNLLADGAVKDYRLVPEYEWPGMKDSGNWTQRAACVPGKAYTLSIVTDVAGEVCFGFYLADGSLVRPKGYEVFNAGQYVVRTLTAPEGAEYVAASWAEGNRRPMVVEGTEPAAWGALMSANLWDASAVNFKPDADGVYICGTSTGELNCSIAGASALSANQTVHFGASLRGAGKGYLSPFVEYRNAVGNLNWVGFPHWTPTDQWQRFEATCVVPSGMTITKIGFNTSGATGDIEVMNPAWSYGSPVPLATSAHTPYATQDHISATYATKASLKVTDDSVKAEVSARAQTDRNVADLSSRLTQTANSLTSEISDRRTAITTVTGLANTAQSTADAAQTMATENQSSIKQLSDSITSEVSARTETDRTVSDLSSRLTQTASGLSASISKLSETDEKVNAWFDFGADSSGNPQLKMGSSTSPVVGTYTNSGLAYRSRDGATIMELDASRSATISDHMEAQDMKLGKWKWVQTQGGTHLTLVWAG